MKNYNIKKSYIALAIVTALTSNITFAEEVDISPELKKSGLEHIEVTARRTVENLQEVPISITSIGAEAIAQNGITDVTDIQQYATNTTLQVSRGSSSTLTAYIRGIGQADPLWGFEPGVGLYVDDVYIARPQGGVMEILDVERIEILRGPQGTLYGKNTIGGAMKYITKKMSGDNTFDVSATVGNYGLNTYKAAGQLSLMNDKLYIGAAIADVNRDGFGTFVNDTDIVIADPFFSPTPAATESAGDDNYNKDLVAARLSIEYHATDNLFFKLAYDQTVDNSNAKGGYRLNNSDLIIGQTPYDNVFNSDTSLPTYNKVETSGLSLTIDWHLTDHLSFKSVTADRKGDTYTNIDFDNTVLKILDVPAIYDDEQFTQELQLSYFSDGITAVGGLYYYTGNACGAFDVQSDWIAKLFDTPVFTEETSGCTTTESYSAYGQTSFDLTDKWSMTIGGRYTQDTKDADVSKFIYLETVFPGDTDDGIPASINPNNKFSGKETWSHFSPRIGVEYQASDNVMYYVSYANGFKSGGYNMRGDLGRDPEAATPFSPETVDTFEVGFKSEPTENFRLNATYYYSDYQDMQVAVGRITDTGIVTRILNAGSAEIQGFELTTMYTATDNLTLNLNIGHIDGKFIEFLTVDPDTTEIINSADQMSVPNTPDLTINLGAKYEIVANIGDFVFSANASYRADTQIVEAESALDQEAYTLINAGMIFYHADGNWSASLQGKNIFNKQVRVAGYNYGVFAGGEEVTVAYYNDPATVALTVKYEF